MDRAGIISSGSFHFQKSSPCFVVHLLGSIKAPDEFLFGINSADIHGPFQT